MADLTKILTKVKNDWVALSPKDKSLVGSGKTLKIAISKARKEKISNPIVFKVGRFEVNLAG